MEFNNRWFGYKDFDSHYNILLFGIRIRIKHDAIFEVKEVQEYGVTNYKKNPQLIVSLTSFPQRIQAVVNTIKTLLNQTTKPDRIVLWLAEEQFPQLYKDLPDELKNLEKFGLEIKWCEDLRSYKKLIPSLRECPADIIVTADDDILYAEDWLESLYNEYLKNPENIYVRRARRVFIEENRIKHISVKEDIFTKNEGASYKNRIAGGSGCLFPPASLHPDVMNIDLVKNLIPTHDDVFFWAMGVLNKRKIQVVKGFSANMYVQPEVQKYGLCKINRKGNSGTPIQEAFDKISQKYPEILEIIKNEDVK